MKRKAFVGDLALYVILIFCISLSLFVIYLLVTTYNTAWQGTPGINTGELPSTIMSRYKDRFVETWDFFSVLLIIGLVIGLGILAFAIRSHPAFAFLTLILLVILVLVSMHFSNAFHDVASTDTFSGIATEMDMTTTIMINLPKILVMFGIMFIILLYAKRDTGVNL